jgi:hypothetical protein
MDLQGGYWIFNSANSSGWTKVGTGRWWATAGGAALTVGPAASSFIPYVTTSDPTGFIVSSGTTSFSFQAPTYTGTGVPTVFGNGQVWRINGAMSWTGSNTDIRVYSQNRTSASQKGGAITTYGGLVNTFQGMHYGTEVTISNGQQMGVVAVANQSGSGHAITLINDPNFTYADWQYVGSA